MIIFVFLLLGFGISLWLFDHRKTLSGRNRWIFIIAALASFAVVVVSLPDPFVIRKILGSLAMPTGLIWLGLIATSLVAVVKGKRRLAAGAIVLLCCYSLAGNGVIGALWLGWLQRDFIRTHPLELDEPFEAIFVLGGGTLRGANGDIGLSDHGDRVLLAARMYRRGLTPLLVASGRAVESLGEERDASLETQEIWTSLGIPDEAILRIPEPRTTGEEILAYRALADERGWRRMGLITSAFHLRRAMRRCEREGLEVTALPANVSLPPFAVGFYSLIPDGRGFQNVQFAAWETLGAALGQ